ELTVEVQLVGNGVAPAIELGGTLLHPGTAVQVRAPPDNLPETLHYDLSPLVDFETTVTVADIEVPEGVTIQAEPTDVVARVLAPRVETEETAEAGAVAEGE